MKLKTRNTPNGAQVSEGLKRSIHADQDIKKPEYHKHEKGHSKRIKRI